MYRILGFSIRSGYAELRGPGVNGFLLARERYIDDVLQDSLGFGLQQLVILGAGYDSRPYRFDLSGKVKVFEVDHPLTQTDKLEKVRRIFGEVPVHVAHVPVDFNTQLLSDRLLSSGFDPALVSLFIWQGVTMYLSPAGVDATLSFVVNNTAPRSSIVFDYVYQSVLVGLQKQSEITNMRRYRFLTGEALTFGIPQGSVQSFLLERGFHQVMDISTAELKAAYMTGKMADRKVAGGYGIAIGKT
jgi:methyltransferase (TIGR00027 family)